MYYIIRKLCSNNILPNQYWKIFLAHRVVGKARRTISPDQKYIWIYWTIFDRGCVCSISCNYIFSTACQPKGVEADSSLATERRCHGLVCFKVLFQKRPKDARGRTSAFRSDMEQCTLCPRSIRRVLHEGSGWCYCWSNQTESRPDRYQSKVSYQCRYEHRKAEPNAASLSTLAVVKYSAKMSGEPIIYHRSFFFSFKTSAGMHIILHWGR